MKEEIIKGGMMNKEDIIEGRDDAQGGYIKGQMMHKGGHKRDY